jgi:hypothetical protein
MPSSAFAKVLLPDSYPPQSKLGMSLMRFVQETGALDVQPPAEGSGPPGHPCQAVLEYSDAAARAHALRRNQQCPGEWGFFVQPEELVRERPTGSPELKQRSRGRRGCRGGNRSGREQALGSQAVYGASDSTADGESDMSSPPITRPVTPVQPVLPLMADVVLRPQSPPVLVVPKASRPVPSVLSEHSLECIAEADLPDLNALDDVDVLPSSETLSPYPRHSLPTLRAMTAPVERAGEEDSLDRPATAPPEATVDPRRPRLHVDISAANHTKHMFIHFDEPRSPGLKPNRRRSQSAHLLDVLPTPSRRAELEDAQQRKFVAVHVESPPGSSPPVTPPPCELAQAAGEMGSSPEPTPDRVSPARRTKCHRGSRGKGGKKKQQDLQAPGLGAP